MKKPIKFKTYYRCYYNGVEVVSHRRLMCAVTEFIHYVNRKDGFPDSVAVRAVTYRTDGDPVVVENRLLTSDPCDLFPIIKK